MKPPRSSHTWQRKRKNCPRRGLFGHALPQSDLRGETVLDLDHLANGRLLVGVGLGSKATRESDEFGVFGVPYERRGDRADEYIQAMKAVWTQPWHLIRRFHRVKNAGSLSKAGSETSSARLGGRLDEARRQTRWEIRRRLDTRLAFAEEMKVGCDILAQTARDNGRDPSKITIAVEKLATIAKREEGLNLAMPTLKTSSESYERDIDSMQFALDRHIFGSVDDVRRRIDEFIENGVQHFELKVIYPTMDSLQQQMELWAENILPRYN